MSGKGSSEDDKANRAVNRRREAMRAAARRPTRAVRQAPIQAAASAPAPAGKAAQSPSKIFISYCRRDIDAVSNTIARLRSWGAKVTWDQDFPAGVDIELAIRSAIEGAHSVIVVWSRDSVRSPYVRDEARQAFRATKLVPTHVPDFDFADVPMGLGDLNAIPLGDDERLRRSLAERGLILTG